MVVATPAIDAIAMVGSTNHATIIVMGPNELQRSMAPVTEIARAVVNSAPMAIDRSRNRPTSSFASG